MAGWIYTRLRRPRRLPRVQLLRRRPYGAAERGDAKAQQRHFAAVPPDRPYNIAGVNPATPASGLPPDAVGEFFALLADIVSGRWEWERENGPEALLYRRALDERLTAMEMHAFGEAAPSTGSVLFDLIMEKGADNAMLAHIGQSLERRTGRLEEHVFETDVEL